MKIQLRKKIKKINCFDDEETWMFLTKEEHDKSIESIEEEDTIQLMFDSKIYQQGYNNTVVDFQR